MNFSDDKFYARLKRFIQHTGLNNNKFAEKVGLSGAQVYYMVNAQKNFGIDKLLKIFNTFPELNAEWLLKGKGDMVAGKKKVISGVSGSLQMPKVVTIDANGKNNIVQIDAKAAAGFPANYDNPQYFESLPAFSMPSPQFQDGTYICLQANGDSMHPTIYHHDWLIAEFLENPIDNIREGYVHVVVTKDGVVVKRVLNRLDKRNKLVLQSDNEQYPTYEEDLSNVLQVYKVQAKLSFVLRNENSDVRKDINSIKAELFDLRTQMKK